MARPKKQTVDYFPHNCKHGKTMFILEQKYGNDGYAFWFKLLEMIGSSEGHYLSLREGMDWEFLIAKTRLDVEKCTEILDLLATLEAIDNKLWFKNKIVWSDGFIENVKDAYRNRTVDIPVKPSFLRKKSTSNGIKDVNNPHIILKDIKVEKNKDKYGEFVLLSKDQYQKLIDKLGQVKTDDMIEKLNGYIGQIGVKKASAKYTSHYHTILNWVRMEEDKKPKSRDIPVYKPEKEFKRGEIPPEIKEHIKKIKLKSFSKD